MARLQLLCALVFASLLSFSAGQDAPAPAPAEVPAPAPAPGGAPATAPSASTAPLPCPCSLVPGSYDPFTIDLKATLLATGNCPQDLTDPDCKCLAPPVDCSYGYNNKGGCGNVGCSNYGTGNTGNFNTGTNNVGEFNDGTGNTGFHNSGTNNKGCQLGGTATNDPASCNDFIA